MLFLTLSRAKQTTIVTYFRDSKKSYRYTMFSDHGARKADCPLSFRIDHGFIEPPNGIELLVCSVVESSVYQTDSVVKYWEERGGFSSSHQRLLSISPKTKYEGQFVFLSTGNMMQYWLAT